MAGPLGSERPEGDSAITGPSGAGGAQLSERFMQQDRQVRRSAHQFRPNPSGGSVTTGRLKTDGIATGKPLAVRPSNIRPRLKRKRR